MTIRVEHCKSGDEDGLPERFLITADKPSELMLAIKCLSGNDVPRLYRHPWDTRGCMYLPEDPTRLDQL